MPGVGRVQTVSSDKRSDPPQAEPVSISEPALGSTLALDNVRLHMTNGM